ncbi:MAG TPA: hypothetical protein VMV48_07320 [Gallionellaceae bacterium]|nr:hypothetical protein [Gallionellaceae bacterium]
MKPQPVSLRRSASQDAGTSPALLLWHRLRRTSQYWLSLPGSLGVVWHAKGQAVKNLLGSLRRQPVSPRSGASSVLSLWNRVRLVLRRWLRRMGWPGMLAVGIFAVSAAFFFSAIRPEQARLDRARQGAVALNEQLALDSKSLNGSTLSAEDQLTVFYEKFPTEGNSSQWLGKLLALATNRGLSLNDGEYKATRDRVGKLVRYQMTFPVKGPYPKIRQFLTDLPDALPVVALENVQFERQKVADPDVEAKIKLVLYLEQAS